VLAAAGACVAGLLPALATTLTLTLLIHVFGALVTLLILLACATLLLSGILIAAGT